MIISKQADYIAGENVRYAAKISRIWKVAAAPRCNAIVLFWTASVLETKNMTGAQANAPVAVCT
jgi:hypothetical protein